MARNDGIDRTSVRNVNLTNIQIPNTQRHSEREKESLSEESFTGGLLEYPQYTRPQEFMGKKVPDVLLSGNHAEIEKWRKAKSLKITEKNRPDLLK